MGRLIEADDLRKQFDEGCWNDAVAEVDAQPTAYDVEAVVRELEAKSKLYSLSDRDCEFAIPLNKAVEIVMAGGRNE